MQRYLDRKIEEKIENHLRILKNLKPEDFDVPDRFSLDEKTIKNFQTDKKNSFQINEI